jgi:hypothetical protein
VFNGTDRITGVKLPDDVEELEDFDFSDAIGELDDDTTDSMTLDQLKAEAIERGIEVRADSTRDELTHALDLDYHAGNQANERKTDRTLSREGGYAADRIGMRTSNVLPNANGLDLERMNTEQLKATAASLGLKTKRGAKRADMVNEITAEYAKRVGAPNGAPKAPADSTEEFGADLEGLDADALKEIAEKEDIDVGRSTSVDGLTQKIIEGRQAKAEEDNDNG